MNPYDQLLKKIYDTEHHGAINYLVGGKGTGKTHEAVYHMHHLVKNLGYAVITNVQFLDDDGELDMPEDVYFAKDFKTMWQHVREIREEDYSKPILICIDEFQEFVHRYRTLKEEVLAVDKWFRTFRKMRFSGLFITQNIFATVPRNLLIPTDYIILKKKSMTNEFNRKHKSTPPQGDGDYWNYQELSFIMQVQEGYYTLTYPDGTLDYQPIKDFKDHELTVIDTDGLLQTGQTEWTEEWFSTYGSAVFELGEVNGTPGKEWVPALTSKLGETTPKETPEAIKEFFEDFKKKEEKIDWKDVLEFLDQEERDYWELSPGQGQKRIEIPMSDGNLSELIRKNRGRINEERS